MSAAEDAIRQAKRGGTWMQPEPETPGRYLATALASDDPVAQAGNLVAALAAENAAHLAHTTNMLIASERQRALDLGQALFELFDALDRIPDFARTVAVERALIRAAPSVADAREGLSGGWYPLPEHEDQAEGT